MTRARLAALALAALATLALLAGAAFAAPVFPALTGRVVDEAGILSPQAEAQLAQRLETLERETGRQLVVVTLSSLQGYEIEDFGYQLGRAWGIGRAGQDDGVLLIVAPNERRVRIEVGYGLEPVLTDALSSTILTRAVLPRFRAGDLEGGVVDGADAIIEQLALPAEEAQARVEAAAARDDGVESVIAQIVIFFVIALIILSLTGGFGGRGGGRWSGPVVIVPGGFSGGRRGRGRGGFGGGFGGGGFRGGGGSFGGGGASGRW